jgi:hypothetical protein
LNICQSQIIPQRVNADINGITVIFSHFEQNQRLVVLVGERSFAVWG